MLVVASLFRVLAAVVLQSFVQKLGPTRLCLFDDANYYWLLARTIRQGVVYQIIEWGTISHKALRTPGYPLFLAACQAVFGEWPLGVRLIQAVLGTVSVGLVYLLTMRLGPSSPRRFRQRCLLAGGASGGRDFGCDQSLLRGHLGAAAIRSAIHAAHARNPLGASHTLANS